MAALPLVLVGCSNEEEGALATQPQTANTGLAVSSNYPDGVVSAGELVFVLVHEVEQGHVDLNGDGDVSDNVVHVVDMTTGEITNLGMSARHNMASDGTTVAWVVAEEDAGTVLNGDADEQDYLLAVYDTTIGPAPNNPRVTQVLVDPHLPLMAENGFIAFATREVFGGTDLTGDGTLLDTVVGVFEAGPSSLYVTGVAAPLAVAYELKNGVLAFTAAEAGSATDFNLDGDTNDVTLLYHVPGSGTNVSVDRAVHPLGFTIAGTEQDPVLAYAIDEVGQGSSLNVSGPSMDTDAADYICAIFDLNTATEAIPARGLAIQPLRMFGSETRLGVSAVEAENGNIVAADFNDDNDADDVVPFWIDLDQPYVANNVGVAHDPAEDSLFPYVCNEFMLILANEVDHGAAGTNFNVAMGDDDMDDTVLCFVDIRTSGVSTTTNLGLACNQLICATDAGPSWILAVADEAANGNTDLNSDGDSVDETLAYFPVSPGGAVDSTLRVVEGGGTSNSIAYDCQSAVAIVNFAEEGTGTFFTDVNKDLDRDDHVATLQFIDKSDHRIGTEKYLGTLSELVGSEGFPLRVGASSFAFPAVEYDVGDGVDYNGDGDMIDSVLFCVTVDCP